MTNLGRKAVELAREQVRILTEFRRYKRTKISTYASQVYEVVIPDDFDHHELTHDQIHGNVARSSNPEHLEKTNYAIDTIRSVGPLGYDKLEPKLVKAFKSLPATKGIELAVQLVEAVVATGYMERLIVLDFFPPK
ncbi:hypothetical protein F511_33735 [Dorcoceras hygrometricum]|uniref:Uncharacterized protein n=1 Tax=Dorcoceras hygrometricum TaxID=472368 RepID=A0A2Z7CTV1_9LAMI|nr:hypothetical protein F511_33735 [Dorcoceras hygrometricum]